MAKSGRDSGADKGELYGKIVGLFPRVTRSASEQVGIRARASRDLLDRYRAKAGEVGAQVKGKLVQVGIQYVEAWTARTGLNAPPFGRLPPPAHQQKDADPPNHGDPPSKVHEARGRGRAGKKSTPVLETPKATEKPRRKSRKKSKVATAAKKRTDGSKPKRSAPKSKRASKSNGASKSNDSSKARRSSKKTVALKRPSSKTKAIRNGKTKRGAA